MRRAILSLFGAMVLAFGPWVAPSFSQDKLKFATSVREYHVFYLPAMAAEEQGFWKQNGLEVTWSPMPGGGAMIRALAGRAIDAGFTSAATAAQGAAGGVPAVIVSDLYPKEDFFVWVRKESRFKEPKDLKGARLGVARYGGMEHAYGRMVAKALGMERDVRIVSSGGITEALGQMKAGVIDGVVQPLPIMISLKVAGEVREFIAVPDYLPKEWVDMVTVAHKEWAKTNPGVARRMVKALLQSMEFVGKNARWSMDKMKATSGYSEEVARLMFDSLRFSKDGKIEKKALENVRNFLIEYGITPRDKTPGAEELYSTEFLGG